MHTVAPPEAPHAFSRCAGHTARSTQYSHLAQCHNLRSWSQNSHKAACGSQLHRRAPLRSFNRRYGNVVAQAGTVGGLGQESDKPRNRKAGQSWLKDVISRFSPMTKKASNTYVLDFERPLVELDNRIKEVRKVAEENGVDVSASIQELEERARQLRKDTYSRLTAVQRLQVARHPNRPTFLDIALNISDKFVELHGDRAGLDDPAMVCGLADIDDMTFMFIGHQKGRNTKENIFRNFGMPQPNGYRKALRFMQHADKFGFPIVTFVDTPGAFAGKTAEDLGQGEAIAVNLREMFGLRVPIISVVIGEGGSGGALAIGCANRSLIMENSVYYVASPEACAAILWKSRSKAPAATEALKVTADHLYKFKVMDHIIPEPLGGAHGDPMGSFPFIKKSIMDVFYEYKDMSVEDLLEDRYNKFRKIGMYEEYKVPGGQWREVKAARDKAKRDGTGVTTKDGRWAIDEKERDSLEAATERDKKWAETLKGKEQWLHPLDPVSAVDALSADQLQALIAEIVQGLKEEGVINDSAKTSPATLDSNAAPEHKGPENGVSENSAHEVNVEA